MDLNKIYKTNHYGDLRIINYTSSLIVEVEFINTGYRTTTQKIHIMDGKVKDKYLPTVYGVGFLGVGRYTASLNNKNTKIYTTWNSMLSRCYCDRYKNTKPTYKECIVCDEWHNFQVFAKWFESNYVDGFELDKDIKIKGNKIYSPKTCIFVSKKENITASTAKTYNFISPDGVNMSIYNLSKFCRDNNLGVVSMYMVHSGKQSSYKNWRAIK